MKYVYILIIELFISGFINGQKLEVVGGVKVTGMMMDNSSDSLVVWTSDSMLAYREANSLEARRGSILGAREIQLNANQTRYTRLPGASPTNEGGGTMIAPRDGVLKNLFAWHFNGMPSDASVDIIVRVNGDSTGAPALTIDSDDGTNVISDTENSIAVSKGDKVVVVMKNTSLTTNAGYGLNVTLHFE